MFPFSGVSFDEKRTGGYVAGVGIAGQRLNMERRKEYITKGLPLTIKARQKR